MLTKMQNNVVITTFSCYNNYGSVFVMNEKEIYKKVIFTKNDIKSYFRTEAELRYWIEKRISMGLIRRIKRDLYCISDLAYGSSAVDQYMVASAITKTSYVAYHSAMDYYGWANQVYRIFFIASETRFSSFEFDGAEFVYVKSPNNLQIDTIEEIANIRITSVERTIVDMIHNSKWCGGIEEVLNALECITQRIDEKKLIEMLDYYNDCFLYKKVGFLLEVFNEPPINISKEFFDYCKSKMGKDRHSYMKELERPLIMHKEWNLYAPSELSIFGYIHGGVYIDEFY